MTTAGQSWHNVMPDKGCKHHPACLTCPFERCLLEGEPRVMGPTIESQANRQRILELKEKGMGPTLIAETLGLARRTVQRHLREAREHV